ncbi:MAG: GNAT family N-acetyltransferase, partial [Spirochaetes bacterium]|nr:GNAT family N-acetyltransferase [Spirochaetota bacterium]
YYRTRLLLLGRELLKQKNKVIPIVIGQAIQPQQLKDYSAQQLVSYLKMRTYLLSSQLDKNEQNQKEDRIEQTIIAPIDKKLLSNELSQLPAKQHLLDYKTFSVYYGYYEQLPNVIKEIGRLREVTFRKLKEGSGLACDTDEYDKTYTQLFIWDNREREIIGAYRFGESERLMENDSIQNMYLTNIFHFSQEFINQNFPALEMGRSFIIEKHQRSFYGLFLLWRGIGEFLLAHPYYRTLYGTVSLSLTYSQLSLELMEQVLITPTNKVQAKYPMQSKLIPEVVSYLNQNTLSISELSILIKSIEKDHKDLPVLVKQYAKLGAVFHKIALDKNFLNTPGLLLTVNMEKVPLPQLNSYLNQRGNEYLNYQEGF